MRPASACFLIVLWFSAAPLHAAPNFSTWAYPGTSGRVISQPDALGNRVMDYSNVGYQGGTVALPSEYVVPVKVTLSPLPGDNRARVQSAIDDVSAMPMDTNGFRGAVLLLPGEYPMSSPLNINAGGVVLRGAGSGTNGAILRATGSTQYSLVQVSGSGSASTVSGTTHNITNLYVPVGARSFQVDSTNGLAIGDHVFVRRIATSNWIHDLGMDLLTNPWPPSGYNIDMDRVITHIESNRVFVDAPITTAIDAHYTNGTIRKFTWSGRIQNVGIEHLRGVSNFTNSTDENHGWIFAQFNKVENAWARDLVSQYFGYACVALYSGTRAATVLDCQCLDPISIITGGRRYAFVVDDATCSLVKNCYTKLDRHQFVTQSLTTGPNVFVDGLSDSAQADAGPHHRWGNGALWDATTINGNSLNVQNRGNLGSGHGWSGANEVVWNCKASSFVVQNPPTARNWLIGSVGAIRNGTVYVGPHDPGTYESSGSTGSNVFPNSLYHAQLQDRMMAPNLQTRDHWLGQITTFTNGAGGGESVPTDTAWRAEVQVAAGGQALDGFDVITGSHWVPFTFAFSLGASQRMVAATLSLAMRAASNAANNLLYLDSTNNGLSFSNLNWLPIGTGTNTTVRVVDLAGQLDLLSDGKLNAAMKGDGGIDWAMLELQIAPMTPSFTNSLTPVADAYIRGGSSATLNFGVVTTLSVNQDSAAENQRRACLQWDLSSVTGQVLSARVQLTAQAVGMSGLEHGATLITNNSWSESAVTWNNQPGASKRFATWIPKTNSPVEFVVTPQVQDALAGNRQISFGIVSLQNGGASGSVDYASREAANPIDRPQLLLIIAGTAPVVVPPTPTFALSATPDQQTLSAGGSASYGLTITATNGFTNTVTLSVTGSPAGITVSLSPLSVIASGVSTLSVTTVSELSPGNYPLTIVGESAVATNTLSVLLVIAQPLTGWGDNSYGQCEAPLSLNSSTAALAAGSYHNLAIRPDGTVIAWGNNAAGQCDVPEDLGDVVAVAAGAYHSLALRNDGSIVAWGDNFYGQTSVPEQATNVVAISTGNWHSLALREDGSIVAWGDSSSGKTAVPSVATNVVAISAGGEHNLALRADGKVLAWGSNLGAYGDYAGQTDVPPTLGQIVAIAAGGYHSLALRASGTVVAWGDNSAGQSTVPSDLERVIAISGGALHSLALQEGGHVVGWGNNLSGQLGFNPALSGVTAVAAGGYHTLTLVGQPEVGPRLSVVRTASGAVISLPAKRGKIYWLQYQNSLNGANWEWATPVLGHSGTQNITNAVNGASKRFYRVRQQ